MTGALYGAFAAANFNCFEIDAASCGENEALKYVLSLPVLDYSIIPHLDIWVIAAVSGGRTEVVRGLLLLWVSFGLSGRVPEELEN